MSHLTSCVEELIAEIEAQLEASPSFRELIELEERLSRLAPGAAPAADDLARMASIELDVAALPLGHAWATARELRRMLAAETVGSAADGAAAVSRLLAAASEQEAKGRPSRLKSFAERIAAATAA